MPANNVGDNVLRKRRIAQGMVRDPLLIGALLAGPPGWLALLWLDLLPATLGVLVLLRFVIVQPVIEELVFRGLLQGWLREKLKWQRFGISVANLLASIAFVAAHLFYQPPAWALAVFVPSLVFGYFRDRHDSVIPSIILHFWYNAGFFLLPLFLS